MTRSAGVSPAGRDASRVPIILFVAFFAFGTLMCLLTIVLLAFPGTAFDALWRANPEAHEAFAAHRAWASPLITRNVSSRNSIAFLMLPAVPSGCSSMA